MVFESEKNFLGVNNLKQSLQFSKILYKDIRILRHRLGNEAHLLDQYLSCLTRATNLILAYEAATEGFESLSELREICRDIIHNQKKDTVRTFYQKAKNFIAVHPLACRDPQTQISLYTILLSASYLEIVADQYCHSRTLIFDEEFDFSAFKKLHEDICNQLGEEMALEKIDEFFQSSFMMLSPMSCWLQGAWDSLLVDLTSWDAESHKLIAQLLIEDIQL